MTTRIHDSTSGGPSSRQLSIWLLTLVTATCLVSAHPQGGEATANQFLNSRAGITALEYLEQTHASLMADIITLTEIPAPPFGERLRGEEVMRRFKALGLRNVQRDAAGNILGERPGRKSKPLIVVSAHLDTVFPEGTTTKVKREGNKLMAPGIGDDVRSLAVILAVIRALDHARVKTSGTVLFVATVGEEGLGDLRGVKYLFQKGPWKGRIDAFISIDGTGDDRITNQGIGSRRYRVTYRGPGGHSWGAFGLVNPAFAMGQAMERIARLQVPRNPKTSFNIGRVGGGTSINSIPFESWMEIDMRSEDQGELKNVEERVLQIVRQAAADENRARDTSEGEITAEAKLVGDRPAGVTSPDSKIVQMTLAAGRVLGIDATLRASSTDSNVPISLGIPAVTIGSGGKGGRSHSLDEWIDVGPEGVRGVKRVLILTVLLAGR